MSQTTDAPIPALLPRDWPRRLADLLLASGLDQNDTDVVLETVDAWVLAATSDDA